MLVQDAYLSAEELGLTELNPFVSVDISEKTDDEGNPVPGTVYASLSVTEDLEFHRNLDREKGDPMNQFFAEDSTMTERVQTVLEKIIEDRYKGEDLEIEEDFIRFNIVLEVPEDTTPEDLGTKFWEDTALVQFHNEADPGTFGTPYLFGELVYAGLRELELSE